MGTPIWLCPFRFQREAGTCVLSLPLTTNLKGVCHWLFYIGDEDYLGEQGNQGVLMFAYLCWPLLGWFVGWIGKGAVPVLPALTITAGPLHCSSVPALTAR